MVHWLYTRVIRPFILYGSLVWWPKVMQKTTKNQLGRIQRMACLTIMGAVKSTPTAAIEMLLNLAPLDLLIMVEARMTLYRLHILKLGCYLEKCKRPHTGLRSDHTICL